MVNFVLNKLGGAKLVAGLLAAQSFLSGKKTHLAGGILILQGLSCLLDQILGLGGLGDVIGFVKSLPADACVAQIAQGLGLVGVRVAITKASQPPA